MDNVNVNITLTFFYCLWRMDLTTQVAWLFILAIPTACIAWTVTHEEVFREPREYLY